jgi:hypothetical protein
MTHEELLKVLDRTVETTKKRQAKWKPVAADVLSLSFPRSSMQIKKYFDRGYGRNQFDLSLYNSVGNKIATIDYENFAEAQEALENLFYMAYTIAYEVDETINDILGGLDSPSATEHKK